MPDRQTYSRATAYLPVRRRGPAPPPDRHVASQSQPWREHINAWSRRSPRSNTRGTGAPGVGEESARAGREKDFIGDDRIDGRVCHLCFCSVQHLSLPVLQPAETACTARRSQPPAGTKSLVQGYTCGPGRAAPSCRRSGGTERGSGGQPSRPGMIRLTFRTTSGSKRTRYPLFTTGGESARQGVRGCHSRARAVTRPEPDPWPRRWPGERR
jgi:hypothetical protein